MKIVPTSFEHGHPKVKVFEDPDDGVERPDSVFPNNWFSCHDSGLVLLYPMLSECRRRERRRDVVQYLRDTRRVSTTSKHGGSSLCRVDECPRGDIT